MAQTPSKADLQQRIAALTDELHAARQALAAAEAEQLVSEERANELALQMARLKARASTNQRVNIALLDGIRFLTEALNPPQILQGTLTVLREVLSFEEAFLLLPADDGSLRVAATTHPRFEDSAWSAGDFFRGVLSGQILATYDTSLIPEWQALDDAVREGASSALHVPIVTVDQQAILICTHAQRDFFTREHIDLAGHFAVLAAQALRNAELYTALARQRDRLEEHVRQRTEELTDERDFAVQIMQTMAQGLTVVDGDGRFEYVNPAYAAMLGYEPEALLGLSPYEFTSEADLTLLKDAQERRAAGQTDTYETRLKRRDGTAVIARITATPRYRHGQPDGSIAVITDLTAGRAAEREQRAAEARTRLMIDTALDAVIGMDADGLITDWSDRAEEAFGWSREEALGRRMSETIIPVHMRAAHEEGLARYLRTGEHAVLNKRIEITALHRMGHEFPVELSIAPLRINNTVSFSAFVRDITHRKEAVTALQQAKEVAEKAAEAKAAFLASISHEIRTPLNAIIGLTGLLQETFLSAQQRDYVATVFNSGNTLLVLINDILDFSKVEAGKLSLEMQPVDVAACLTEAIELVRTRADTKGLRLHHEIDAAVPPHITSDITRLRQVLVNLLSNAVKFTEKGAVTATVGAEDDGDGRYLVTFRVQDTGIGIAAEHRHHLFQPFSQVDASTTRKYGGTGLGLAISKEIVELMGGEIGVESTPGAGSMFHFTIPAGAARAPTISAGDASPEIDPAMGRRHPLRILVAEDNPVNQKVIRHLLQEIGYRPNVVANGLEVLEALRRQPYDVVLMDIQMPEMDGVTAAGHIQAQWPANERPRLVAVTANALVEDRAQYLAAGLDDYLSKPIHLAALVTALREVRPLASHPATGPLSKTVDEAIEIEAFITQMGAASLSLHEELVAIFLAHGVGQLAALEAAASTGDTGRIAEIAHQLKGSAAGVAARRMSALCEKLGAAARAGRIDDVDPLVTEIAAAFETVREWAALRYPSP